MPPEPTIRLGKTQHLVLDWLRSQEHPVEARAIAEALALTASAVKGALARLLARGLVLRSDRFTGNVWSATPVLVETDTSDLPTYTPALHFMPRA